MRQPIYLLSPPADVLRSTKEQYYAPINVNPVGGGGGWGCAGKGWGFDKF